MVVSVSTEYDSGSGGGVLGEGVKVSSWVIFYLSFSNIIPSFHTFPHMIQDETNQMQYIVHIHQMHQTIRRTTKQDLQLVLFGDTRPPTETVHLTKSLHVLFVLMIMFPQEDESSELSCSSSAR